MLTAMRTIGLLMLAGPFAPRWCAERTNGASARTVWLGYVVGLALGMVLLVVGVCFAEHVVRTYAYGGAVQPQIAPPRIEPVLWPVSFALAVAATYFAALIAAPLAWRDEPWRDTWRHTLRTVRLFAPAWMLPAALTPVAIVTFLNLANGPEPRPIHLVMLLSISGLALWCYGIIGAAAGAERPIQRAAIEPVCEECGYMLQHLPESRRCPECGTGIGGALDPGARWFPARDSAGAGESAADFRRPGASAWLVSESFFRRVRLDVPAFPLVRRAVLNHAVAGGTAYMTFLVGISVIDIRVPPMLIIGMMAAVFGAITTAVFGVWSAGVGIVGLLASAGAQRNLLRAALVVAAYTCAFQILWGLLAAGGIVGIAIMGQLGLVRNPFWPLAGLLTVNCGAALFYIFGVWRRMRYVRYGNWRFAAEDDLKRD